jgi:hypothetical protein
MKIKCYRFECSQCGELASIQVFYRKDETVSYSRARHRNEKGFYYHKQAKEYTIEKLGALTNIDQGQSLNSKIIDHNNQKLSPTLNSVADGEGFAPQSFWRNRQKSSFLRIFSPFFCSPSKKLIWQEKKHEPKSRKLSLLWEDIAQRTLA